MNSLTFATNLQNKTKQVCMKNNDLECFDQGEKKSNYQYCVTRNSSIENKVPLRDDEPINLTSLRLLTSRLFNERQRMAERRN